MRSSENSCVVIRFCNAAFRILKWSVRAVRKLVRAPRQRVVSIRGAIINAQKWHSTSLIILLLPNLQPLRKTVAHNDSPVLRDAHAAFLSCNNCRFIRIARPYSRI